MNLDQIISQFASAHPYIVAFAVPLGGLAINIAIKLLGQSHQGWAQVLSAILSDLPKPPAAQAAPPAGGAK